MQEYIHIPIDVWDVETISIYFCHLLIILLQNVRSRDLYTLYFYWWHHLALQKENVLIPGDPRFDPEARKKKIADLKVKAASNVRHFMYSRL